MNMYIGPAIIVSFWLLYIGAVIGYNMAKREIRNKFKQCNRRLKNNFV
jgi:hypothetical protein